LICSFVLRVSFLDVFTSRNVCLSGVWLKVGVEDEVEDEVEDRHEDDVEDEERR
jgi:hypothetical protein